MFSGNVPQWILAAWSLSIVIQMSASLLIAWRIWSVHVHSSHKDPTIVSVMWTILESGLVLSSATVFLLAFFLIKVVAAAIVIAICGQLDVSSHSYFIASSY